MHAHQLRLEVCSDPRLLGVIRGVLRGWMEAFDLGGEKRYEVILAVDEACSNAMRHAYQGKCDESVELLLAASDDWLEFTVSDQGAPCPPERVQRQPMETPEIHRLQPGGLGVKLIHEVFDEVQFQRGESCGNRVIMRLRRGSDKRG